MECPVCSVPNASGATRCVTCKHPFEASAAADPPTSRFRLEQQEASKALAWLVCDPLPPIPLGTRPQVTIGRALSCDLVLPNNAISRAHAHVALEDGALRFTDSGSFNGSHLNGKRIEGSAVIRPGDVLTLGPYDIEVQAERTDGGAEPEGTQPVNRIEQGLLTQVPLTRTLQDLVNNLSSATLTIISGELRGLFVVLGGTPITATFGDLRDDDAVLAMLALREGRFVLSDRVGSLAITMSTPITALLLEHARRQDEMRP